MVELTRTFLEFEREPGLWSQELKGHCFWPYMRYAIFNELVIYRLGNAPPRRSSRWRYPRVLIRSMMESMTARNEDIGPYDIVLVNYDRTKIVEGRSVNIHTYPLAKHLSLRYRVLLADPYAFRRDLTPYPCDIVSLRPLHYYVRMKSFLLRYSQAECDLIDQLQERIRRVFKCQLDLHRLVKWVYSFQVVWCQHCEELLQTWSPRMIAYCDSGYLQGLIEAANGLEIPTVDLQHSLVTDLNILYRYPRECDKAPPNGSRYIFSFGRYWREEFRLPAEVIETGFPFFDLQAGPYLERAHPNRERNIILIADDGYSRPHQVKVVLELAKLLPSYRIYYKLRNEDYPVWRTRYPRELEDTPNIVVIDHDRVSLYEYLSMCRYQIGTNSTALFEGLAFGLETFIVKAGYYEEMRRLYESGDATLVTCAQEIAEVIQAGRMAAHGPKREELFLPDSLEATERAIERLIEKRSSAVLRGEARGSRFRTA